MDGRRSSARRLLVIYNPTAGRRARRRLERWLAALAAAGAAMRVVATQGRGHAEALAREADPAAIDAVAVAGGDGTINEAVNGLAASRLPLAILPLGTANVLAAELGLPRDLEELAHIAAFAPARVVWPGEAVWGDGAPPRRFLLMAGVGFDADVVERLDLRLKRRIGKGAYIAGILGRLWHHHPRHCVASIDGTAAAGASIIVARSHFYGGRFVLAPAASLAEPRFEAVVFERGSRRSALGYMAAMGLGLLPRSRHLRLLPAERVEVAAPVGAPVQIDGDILGRVPFAARIAATPLHVIAGP